MDQIFLVAFKLGPIFLGLLILFPILLHNLQTAKEESFALWLFLPTILLQLNDDVLQQNPIGLAGGSFLLNIVQLVSIFVPALMVILIGSKLRLARIVRREGIAYKAYYLSWMILILFGIYGAVLSKTRIMPFAFIVGFAFMFFQASSKRIRFENYINAIVKLSVVSAIVIWIGSFIKFPWIAWGGQGIGNQYFLSQYSGAGTQVEQTEIYISPLNHFFGFPVRVSSFFNGGPQIMALFFAMAFVSSLYSTYSWQKRFVTLFLFCTGTLTGSRTFYVMALVGAISYLAHHLLQTRGARGWRLTLFSVPIVVIFLVNLLLPLVVHNSRNLATISGRSVLWGIILRDWSSNGLLGHGPRTLTDWVSQFSYFEFGHAHNNILQYLWDYGLLGAIVSILVSLGSLVLFYGSSRHSWAGLAIALALISGVTELTLSPDISNTLVPFWILLVAGISELRSYKTDGNEDSRDRRFLKQE